MQHKYSKEEKLKNSLKTIQAEQDLIQHQELIKRIANELGLSILDCAAALSFLYQPTLYPKNKAIDNPQKKADQEGLAIRQTRVRYRMEIGNKHKVFGDEIINILVEVSGVERQSIGRLDIRNHYTLVELPEGMPADIFQLLSETEIQNQRLNIKRIKFHRRYYRRNNKQQTKA